MGGFGAESDTTIGEAVHMTETTTDTAPESTDSSELLEELRTWLEENWDPDLTVAQWWGRLGLAGWSAPTLPTNAYGRGLSRGDAVLVANMIAEFGALGAPGGLGLLLAAPTIATHGTPEQVERYVRDIVTGQRAWCQLFSEPGAGSDLAGLQAKAMLDGEEYVVNGQKVWTSGGHYADLGMLIARTNSDVPKHQGITYFAIDMHQEGVDVRPLRELTGRALFNEVFIRFSASSPRWRCSPRPLRSTAAPTRCRRTSSASAAIPGTVGGQLETRAGDYVRPAGKPSTAGGGAAFRDTSKMMISLAQGAGVANDPTIRQDLVRLYTMSQLGRMNQLRVKAARAKGEEIAGMGNISKLSMSDMVRLQREQRDLGLRITGPQGMLHAYDSESRKALDAATGNPFLGFVTEMALFAQAPPIYGGTDQVQKNIIGERVLGLPKEPNQDKVVPFSELPKNA